MNYDHYRKLRSEDERREYMRNFMAEKRARLKAGKSTDVCNVSSALAVVSDVSPCSKQYAVSSKDKTSRASHADVCNELVQFWNQNRGNLPEVLKITKSRRDKVAARTKADPNFAETFKHAVLKARATPFCTGAGGRGWKASFDWLAANDKNYLAVLEGMYGDDIRSVPAQPGPMPQRLPRPELNEAGRALYERAGVSV